MLINSERFNKYLDYVDEKKDFLLSGNQRKFSRRLEDSTPSGIVVKFLTAVKEVPSLRNDNSSTLGQKIRTMGLERYGAFEYELMKGDAGLAAQILAMEENAFAVEWRRLAPLVPERFDAYRAQVQKSTTAQIEMAQEAFCRRLEVGEQLTAIKALLSVDQTSSLKIENLQDLVGRIRALSPSQFTVFQYDLADRPDLAAHTLVASREHFDAHWQKLEREPAQLTKRTIEKLQTFQTISQDNKEAAIILGAYVGKGQNANPNLGRDGQFYKQIQMHLQYMANKHPGAHAELFYYMNGDFSDRDNDDYRHIREIGYQLPPLPAEQTDLSEIPIPEGAAKRLSAYLDKVAGDKPLTVYLVVVNVADDPYQRVGYAFRAIPLAKWLRDLGLLPGNRFDKVRIKFRCCAVGINEYDGIRGKFARDFAEAAKELSGKPTDEQATAIVAAAQARERERDWSYVNKLRALIADSERRLLDPEKKLAAKEILSLQEQYRRQQETLANRQKQLSGPPEDEAAANIAQQTLTALTPKPPYGFYLELSVTNYPFWIQEITGSAVYTVSQNDRRLYLWREMNAKDQQEYLTTFLLTDQGWAVIKGRSHAVEPLIRKEMIRLSILAKWPHASQQDFELLSNPVLDAWRSAFTAEVIAVDSDLCYVVRLKGDGNLLSDPEIRVGKLPLSVFQEGGGVGQRFKVAASKQERGITLENAPVEPQRLPLVVQVPQASPRLAEKSGNKEEQIGDALGIDPDFIDLLVLRHTKDDVATEALQNAVHEVTREYPQAFGVARFVVVNMDDERVWLLQNFPPTAPEKRIVEVQRSHYPEAFRNSQEPLTIKQLFTVKTSAENALVFARRRPYQENGGGGNWLQGDMWMRLMRQAKEQLPNKLTAEWMELRQVVKGQIETLKQWEALANQAPAQVSAPLQKTLAGSLEVLTDLQQRLQQPFNASQVEDQIQLWKIKKALRQQRASHANHEQMQALWKKHSAGAKKSPVESALGTTAISNTSPKEGKSVQTFSRHTVSEAFDARIDQFEQGILDDADLHEIQTVARREGMSIKRYILTIANRGELSLVGGGIPSADPSRETNVTPWRPLLRAHDNAEPLAQEVHGPMQARFQLDGGLIGDTKTPVFTVVLNRTDKGEIRDAHVLLENSSALDEAFGAPLMPLFIEAQEMDDGAIAADPTMRIIRPGESLDLSNEEIATLESGKKIQYFFLVDKRGHLRIGANDVLLGGGEAGRIGGEVILESVDGKIVLRITNRSRYSRYDTGRDISQLKNVYALFWQAGASRFNPEAIWFPYQSGLFKQDNPSTYKPRFLKPIAYDVPQVLAAATPMASLVAHLSKADVESAHAAVMSNSLFADGIERYEACIEATISNLHVEAFSHYVSVIGQGITELSADDFPSLLDEAVKRKLLDRSFECLQKAVAHYIESIHKNVLSTNTTAAQRIDIWCALSSGFSHLKNADSFYTSVAIDLAAMSLAELAKVDQVSLWTLANHLSKYKATPPGRRSMNQFAEYVLSSNARIDQLDAATAASLIVSFEELAQHRNPNPGKSKSNIYDKAVERLKERNIDYRIDKAIDLMRQEGTDKFRLIANFVEHEGAEHGIALIDKVRREGVITINDLKALCEALAKISAWAGHIASLYPNDVNDKNPELHQAIQALNETAQIKPDRARTYWTAIARYAEMKKSGNAGAENEWNAFIEGVTAVHRSYIKTVGMEYAALYGKSDSRSVKVKDPLKQMEWVRLGALGQKKAELEEIERDTVSMLTERWMGIAPPQEIQEPESNVAEAGLVENKDEEGNNPKAAKKKRKKNKGDAEAKAKKTFRADIRKALEAHDIGAALLLVGEEARGKSSEERNVLIETLASDNTWAQVVEVVPTKIVEEIRRGNRGKKGQADFNDRLNQDYLSAFALMAEIASSIEADEYHGDVTLLLRRGIEGQSELMKEILGGTLVCHPAWVEFFDALHGRSRSVADVEEEITALEQKFSFNEKDEKKYRGKAAEFLKDSASVVGGARWKRLFQDLPPVHSRWIERIVKYYKNSSKTSFPDTLEAAAKEAIADCHKRIRETRASDTTNYLLNHVSRLPLPETPLERNEARNALVDAVITFINSDHRLKAQVGNLRSILDSESEELSDSTIQCLAKADSWRRFIGPMIGADVAREGADDLVSKMKEPFGFSEKEASGHYKTITQIVRATSAMDSATWKIAQANISFDPRLQHIASYYRQRPEKPLPLTLEAARQEAASGIEDQLLNFWMERTRELLSKQKIRGQAAIQQERSLKALVNRFVQDLGEKRPSVHELIGDAVNGQSAEQRLELTRILVDHPKWKDWFSTIPMVRERVKNYTDKANALLKPIKRVDLDKHYVPMINDLLIIGREKNTKLERQLAFREWKNSLTNLHQNTDVGKIEEMVALIAEHFLFQSSATTRIMTLEEGRQIALQANALRVDFWQPKSDQEWRDATEEMLSDLNRVDGLIDAEMTLETDFLNAAERARALMQKNTTGSGPGPKLRWNLDDLLEFFTWKKQGIEISNARVFLQQKIWAKWDQLSGTPDEAIQDGWLRYSEVIWTRRHGMQETPILLGFVDEAIRYLESKLATPNAKDAEFYEAFQAKLRKFRNIRNDLKQDMARFEAMQDSVEHNEIQNSHFVDETEILYKQKILQSIVTACDAHKIETILLRFVLDKSDVQLQRWASALEDLDEGKVKAALVKKLGIGGQSVYEYLKKLKISATHLQALANEVKTTLKNGIDTAREVLLNGELDNFSAAGREFLSELLVKEPDWHSLLTVRNGVAKNTVDEIAAVNKTIATLQEGLKEPALAVDGLKAIQKYLTAVRSHDEALLQKVKAEWDKKIGGKDDSFFFSTLRDVFIDNGNDLPVTLELARERALESMMQVLNKKRLNASHAYFARLEKETQRNRIDEVMALVDRVVDGFERDNPATYLQLLRALDNTSVAEKEMLVTKLAEHPKWHSLYWKLPFIAEERRARQDEIETLAKPFSLPNEKNHLAAIKKLLDKSAGKDEGEVTKNFIEWSEALTNSEKNEHSRKVLRLIVSHFLLRTKTPANEFPSTLEQARLVMLKIFEEERDVHERMSLETLTVATRIAVMNINDIAFMFKAEANLERQVQELVDEELFLLHNITSGGLKDPIARTSLLVRRCEVHQRTMRAIDARMDLLNRIIGDLEKRIESERKAGIVPTLSASFINMRLTSNNVAMMRRQLIGHVRDLILEMDDALNDVARSSRKEENVHVKKDNVPNELQTEVSRLKAQLARYVLRQQEIESRKVREQMPPLKAEIKWKLPFLKTLVEDEDPIALEKKLLAFMSGRSEEEVAGWGATLESDPDIGPMIRQKMLLPSDKSLSAFIKELADTSNRRNRFIDGALDILKGPEPQLVTQYLQDGLEFFSPVNCQMIGAVLSIESTWISYAKTRKNHTSEEKTIRAKLSKNANLVRILESSFKQRNVTQVAWKAIADNLDAYRNGNESQIRAADEKWFNEFAQKEDFSLLDSIRREWLGSGDEFPMTLKAAKEGAHAKALQRRYKMFEDLAYTTLGALIGEKRQAEIDIELLADNISQPLASDLAVSKAGSSSMKSTHVVSSRRDEGYDSSAPDDDDDDIQDADPVNLRLPISTEEMPSFPASTIDNRGNAAGNSAAVFDDEAIDVDYHDPIELLPIIAPQLSLSSQLHEWGFELPIGYKRVRIDEHTNQEIEEWVEEVKSILGLEDCALNIILALDSRLQVAYRNRFADPFAWKESLTELAIQMVETRLPLSADEARYYIDHTGIQEDHLLRLLKRRGLGTEIIGVGENEKELFAKLAMVHAVSEPVLLTTSGDRLTIGTSTIGEKYFVCAIPFGDQWMLYDPNPHLGVRDATLDEMRQPITTAALASALTGRGGFARVSPLQPQLEQTRPAQTNVEGHGVLSEEYREAGKTHDVPHTTLSHDVSSPDSNEFLRFVRKDNVGRKMISACLESLLIALHPKIQEALGSSESPLVIKDAQESTREKFSHALGLQDFMDGMPGLELLGLSDYCKKPWTALPAEIQSIEAIDAFVASLKMTRAEWKNVATAVASLGANDIPTQEVDLKGLREFLTEPGVAKRHDSTKWNTVGDDGTPAHLMVQEQTSAMCGIISLNNAVGRKFFKMEMAQKSAMRTYLKGKIDFRAKAAEFDVIFDEGKVGFLAALDEKVRKDPTCLPDKGDPYEDQKISQLVNLYYKGLNPLEFEDTAFVCGNGSYIQVQQRGQLSPHLMQSMLAAYSPVENISYQVINHTDGGMGSGNAATLVDSWNTLLASLKSQGKALAFATLTLPGDDHHFALHLYGNQWYFLDSQGGRNDKPCYYPLLGASPEEQLERLPESLCDALNIDRNEANQKAVVLISGTGLQEHVRQFHAASAQLSADRNTTQSDADVQKIKQNKTSTVPVTGATLLESAQTALPVHTGHQSEKDEAIGSPIIFDSLANAVDALIRSNRNEEATALLFEKIKGISKKDEDTFIESLANNMIAINGWADFLLNAADATGTVSEEKKNIALMENKFGFGKKAAEKYLRSLRSIIDNGHDVNSPQWEAAFGRLSQDDKLRLTLIVSYFKSNPDFSSYPATLDELRVQICEQQKQVQKEMPALLMKQYLSGILLRPPLIANILKSVQDNDRFAVELLLRTELAGGAPEVKAFLVDRLGKDPIWEKFLSPEGTAALVDTQEYIDRSLGINAMQKSVGDIENELKKLGGEAKTLLGKMQVIKDAIGGASGTQKGIHANNYYYRARGLLLITHRRIQLVDHLILLERSMAVHPATSNFMSGDFNARYESLLEQRSKLVGTYSKVVQRMDQPISILSGADSHPETISDWNQLHGNVSRLSTSFVQQQTMLKNTVPDSIEALRSGHATSVGFLSLIGNYQPHATSLAISRPTAVAEAKITDRNETTQPLNAPEAQQSNLEPEVIPVNIRSFQRSFKIVTGLDLQDEVLKALISSQTVASEITADLWNLAFKHYRESPVIRDAQCASTSEPIPIVTMGRPTVGKTRLVQTEELQSLQRDIRSDKISCAVLTLPAPYGEVVIEKGHNNQVIAHSERFGSISLREFANKLIEEQNNTPEDKRLMPPIQGRLLEIRSLKKLLEKNLPGTTQSLRKQSL